MQDRAIQLALRQDFQGAIFEGTKEVGFSHALNKGQPKLKGIGRRDVPDHVGTSWGLALG